MRTDYNRLVQMLKEDSQLSKVTPEAAYPLEGVKTNLQPHRLAEYQARLSKLKVTAISRNPMDQIFFAVWNKDDFPMGGTNEYFVYAESEPADKRYIVESLDPFRRQTDAFAFKKIVTAGIYLLIIGNSCCATGICGISNSISKSSLSC